VRAAVALRSFDKPAVRSEKSIKGESELSSDLEQFGDEVSLQPSHCRSRKLRIVGRHTGSENLLNGSRTVKMRKH
jgi:hypothetical protein